jgi:uncharacterized membrane protein (DUF2068 family)
MSALPDFRRAYARIDRPDPVPAASARSVQNSAPVAKRLTAGYLWIIAFKFAKFVAFLGLGAAALRVARLPPGSLAQSVIHLFGAYERAPLVQHMAAALSVLSQGQIKALGAAAILLALVFATEGTLLAMRVGWAPYVTVILTALGLPFEILEIARRPSSLHRYVLLAANAAILVYLWKRKDEFRPAAARKT